MIIVFAARFMVWCAENIALLTFLFDDSILLDFQLQRKFHQHLANCIRYYVHYENVYSNHNVIISGNSTKLYTEQFRIVFVCAQARAL